MSRMVVVLALVALAGSTMPTTVWGQHAAPGREPTSPLLTTDPALRDSLERIGSRSALWRRALESVSRAGRRVLVLTPQQVVVQDGTSGTLGPFDPAVLAEVAPVVQDEANVSVVLVVVNLPLIEEIHHRKGSLPGEIHADLDRIVLHEIYGHALPYLLAGNLSGHCADPEPRQPAAEACSIQRENEVLAEMGIGRRTRYGLEGLILAHFR